MITLSGALVSALTGPVQRPAFLLQAGFAPVQRWSSHGTVSWGGYTWTQRDMTVEGLQARALNIRGTVVLGNADDVAGALVLSEGVQDRAMAIYGYDAAATATSDIVLLARAVGATAEVGPMDVRIAVRHPAEFQQSPRTYCNSAAGFRTLLPTGTVLRINGVDIKLTRRGN